MAFGKWQLAFWQMAIGKWQLAFNWFLKLLWEGTASAVPYEFM
jgi:hypothetical protein